MFLFYLLQMNWETKFWTKSITPINGFGIKQGFRLVGVAGVAYRPPFPTTISRDSNACHDVVGKIANRTWQIDSISYFQNQGAEKLFKMCKKKGDEVILFPTNFMSAWIYWYTIFPFWDEKSRSIDSSLICLAYNPIPYDIRITWKGIPKGYHGKSIQ